MSYLEKLRDQVVGGNHPQGKPSKPTKGPFEGFVGTTPTYLPEKSSLPNPTALDVEFVLDSGTEARRQKVLAMLTQDSRLERAIITDVDTDPENVIVTIGLRGEATCELVIPTSKYDPFLLLELIEKYSRGEA